MPPRHEIPEELGQVIAGIVNRIGSEEHSRRFAIDVIRALDEVDLCRRIEQEHHGESLSRGNVHDGEGVSLFGRDCRLPRRW